MNRKIKIVIVVIVVISLSGAIVAISLPSRAPGYRQISVQAQNNSSFESVVWTTNNQIFPTLNATSYFQLSGDNSTNSSFTLGVDPSASSGTWYLALIDVHGLISKSFHPSLLEVGVSGGGNSTANFSNVVFPEAYEPTPVNGWYRNNTTSSWYLWNTSFIGFPKNFSVGTTATLQNVSKGSTSSSYFFSFPMFFEILVNATYNSITTLHYYAYLEGVGTNVSAQVTINISDHY